LFDPFYFLELAKKWELAKKKRASKKMGASKKKRASKKMGASKKLGRSFFCLDNDVKLLYDIEVPPEEFDLFMHVVEEFDLNDDEYLLKTIKKNIPLDYDLNNFSLEFINKLRFSDGLKIVLGSADYSIKIWDAESGQLLNTLKDHTDPVLGVVFSSDNLKIVSGGEDSVKIWDAESGQLLNTLRGSECGI
jgi:WD40 repeat protein